MSQDSKLARRETSVPEKTQQGPAVAPLVDIYENNEEILIVADMPGVDTKHLDLRFDKDKITVVGERTEPANEGLLRCEFEPCRFARSFLLPQSVDVDGIRAELASGVLKVHLPKAAHAKPRQIQVTAG